MKKKDKLIDFKEENIEEQQFKVFDRIFSDWFKPTCMYTTEICAERFDIETHKKILLELNDVLMKYCKNKDETVNAHLIIYFYWKSLVSSICTFETLTELYDKGNEAIKP